jgi:hypothetical protein
MTKDEILSMARESGFVTGLRDYADGSGSMPYVQAIGTSTFLPELERFAALVAEKEREGCHAIRQKLQNPYQHCQISAHAFDMAVVDYGAAIRARGNK